MLTMKVTPIPPSTGTRITSAPHVDAGVNKLEVQDPDQAAEDDRTEAGDDSNDQRQSAKQRQREPPCVLGRYPGSAPRPIQRSQRRGLITQLLLHHVRSPCIRSCCSTSSGDHIRLHRCGRRRSQVRNPATAMLAMAGNSRGCSRFGSNALMRRPLSR